MEEFNELAQKGQILRDKHYKLEEDSDVEIEEDDLIKSYYYGK